ncbi:MupA/Atu3671 family FMN-dependent luciferase-like monooxygenase [Pseudovibrio ascidiaceicola]|uniref:MupA/Atu3671 family FMN-dependent luciferase-like monooxygenase n=1 Tax=Pseudovibrio ascidiaceicola TaxID=285279 RepID=UPI003D35A854
MLKAGPKTTFREVENAPENSIASVSHGGKSLQTGLDLSLSFFATDDNRAPGPDTYALVMDATRFADQNGFQSVWLPERHFHGFGGIFPNPSVLAAALSTITQNVGLRAGSVVMPLHHPVRVAEEWAVVDNLSNGRVGISFAAGWNPKDFILSSTDFEMRREATAGGIETVKQLWQGDEVTLEHNGQTEVRRTHPRPVQAKLPVWLTCSGRIEGFTAAARMGANILTHLRGQDIVELPEKIASYRQAWKDAGHDGEGHVTLMMHTYVHECAERVLEDTRGPLQSYLGSSLDLTQASNQKGTGKRKSSSMSSKLREAMLNNACARYMQESGLFGTPDDVTSQLEYLSGAGVNEIACLVDFGVEQKKVMRSLELLADVRQSFRAAHA